MRDWKKAVLVALLMIVVVIVAFAILTAPWAADPLSGFFYGIADLFDTLARR